MLQYGLALKTVRLSRKPRLRERTDKDTGNQWWGVSRTRSLKSLSSACCSRLSQSCIQKPVCHSSKPQGRRDLWRGHLPTCPSLLGLHITLPVAQASFLLSAPRLLPVLFSPFLPKTTNQGCPFLLLTQGAGERGSGEYREASPEIQSMWHI